MKKLGFGILSIVFITMFSGCATTHSVYPASSETGKKVHGVNYALSKATLTVEVPIKLSFYKPGKYAKYAKRLLNLDVGQQPKKAFAIGDPKIATKMIADPKHVYVVKIAGGAFEERELIMELTEVGVLTTATTTVADKTVPLIVETLQTAAGIAGKAIPAGATGRPAEVEINDAALREKLVELNASRRALANVKELVSKERKDWECPKCKEKNDSKQMECESQKEKCKALKKRFKSLLGESGHRLLELTELGKLKRTVNHISSTTARKAVKKAMKEHVNIVVYLKGLKTVDDGKKYVRSLLKKIFDNDNYVNEIMDNVEIKVQEVQAGPTKSDELSVVYISKKGAAALFDSLEIEDAKKIAEQIQGTRQARQQFLTPTTQTITHHGAGTSVVLTELNKQEATLLKPFAGKSGEALWPAKFEIDLPDTPPTTGKHWNIVEVGAERGVWLHNLPNVTQVEKELSSFLVDSLDFDDDPINVTISLNSDPSSQMVGQIPTMNPSPNQPQGFYYRIPANGVVVVSSKQEPNPGRQLARATILIPQYGKVRALPRSTGSLSKSSYALEMYQDGSGLKKITVKADAFAEGTISGIGEAVKTLQDAEATRKAAIEAADAERQAAMKGQAAGLLARSDEITALKAELEVRQLEIALEEIDSDIPESGIE